MEATNKPSEDIRKGPWKAEEDEVLLKHVRKYGPRDWSSIRSKGLLQRTGKSCRLRWVNKLRPNLKNGCKFTAEEETVVIELQAEFGNKWAKIATFLPGRTDNDVKNFWSSRQKRLARILQTNSATSSSKSHRSRKDLTFFHQNPVLEDRTMEENPDAAKTAPPEMIKQELPEHDRIVLQIDQAQPEFTFSPECHELLARIQDPSYPFNVFGTEVGPELGSDGGAQISLGAAALFDPIAGCVIPGNDVKNSLTPDTFFDDFPADMFDQIEPFPSPSDW